MSTIPYVLNRTLRSFRGNLPAHLITTLTITFLISIFGASVLIYINLDKLASNLSRELQIVAYLDPSLQPDSLAGMKGQILKLPGVAGLKYVSSNEGFKRLKDQFKGDENILAGLGEDFLPPTIEIEMHKSYIQDKRHLRLVAMRLSKTPGVIDVRYGQEWIEKLDQAAILAQIIIYVIGALLLVTTIFIVSNTLKLTMYLRHDELETMRLVGATKAFIRGPFLIEGFMQGLFGSGLAIIILFVLFQFVTEQVNFPGFIRFFTPAFFDVPTAAGIILGTSALCIVGSLLSSRRFLRV
ncbi:MAG: permease-like cell division protein FtsX [Pseudomonadota bacterium]